MSAADNRIDTPFNGGGTLSSKLKHSEIKAMRDRLMGALMPKLETL